MYQCCIRLKLKPSIQEDTRRYKCDTYLDTRQDAPIHGNSDTAWIQHGYIVRQSDTYFRPTKSRISVSLYQPAESCLLVSGDESLIQAADTRFFGVVVCISFLYHTCIETYRCESLRKNRYQYMSHRRIKTVSNQLPPSYIYSLRIYTLCRQLPLIVAIFPS